jgi:hypothetical protein
MVALCRVNGARIVDIGGPGLSARRQAQVYHEGLFFALPLKLVDHAAAVSDNQ